MCSRKTRRYCSYSKSSMRRKSSYILCTVQMRKRLQPSSGRAGDIYTRRIGGVPRTLPLPSSPSLLSHHLPLGRATYALVLTNQHTPNLVASMETARKSCDTHFLRRPTTTTTLHISPQIANQPCNTVELAPAPNLKHVHHRRVRSRSLRSRYKNTRNPYGINRRAIKYQIGQERICTETPEHRGRIRYCSLSLSIKPNSTYRFAKNPSIFLRWCQNIELFFVICCGRLDGESYTHTRIGHHDPLPRRPPGSPISLALITSAIRTAKCYLRFFRYSLQRVKIYIIYATESHPT